MAAGEIVDISAGSVDRAVSQSLRKSANEIAPDLMPNSVWEALEFASPVKSVENMARLMASGYLDSGADFYEDRSNFKDQGLADSTMTAAGALVGNELGGGDFSDAYEGKDKYGEKLGTLDRGVRGGRGAVTVVLSAVGTLFGVKQAYKRMMGQADNVVDDLARASDNLDNTAQTTRHAEPVAGEIVPPAKRATGETVLGRYPEYVELSEEIGARRFEIPSDVWNRMSPDEQWIANQKFLDRTIARGDKIRLASALDRATEGTFFRKELDYLFSKGYKISPDGLTLIPPGL